MKIGERFKSREFDNIVTITGINSEGILFEYTWEGSNYVSGLYYKTFLQTFIPCTDLILALS